MRWIKATGAMLTILLLVTSCLKVESEITVEDDGSGTVEILSAVNAEALGSIFGELAEEDLGGGDFCEEAGSDTTPEDVPADAVITPYREGDFCGTRVQYSLTPSTDLSDQVGAAFDSETTRLYKEGDNWFFDTELDTEGVTEGSEDLPPAMFESLFEDASIKIVIDLPGRAIEGENNATEVGADGRFTWDIDILNPPTRLFAQTEPGSGGGSGGGGGGISPLLIGLIVAAALGLGALAFFMSRKSGGSGATDLAGVNMDPATPATHPLPTNPLPTSPPLQDVDPYQATATPVIADDNAVKETVIMSSADLIAQTNESTGTQAATEAAEVATPSTQPVYDEALGAWTVNDPTRGRLRHDPVSDTWNPV